jgi:hypothetical protein
MFAAASLEIDIDFDIAHRDLSECSSVRYFENIRAALRDKLRESSELTGPVRHRHSQAGETPV